MKLTTKGEYALRLVLKLGQVKGETLARLDTIADKENIPLPYLRQLLKNLKKDGIIKSARGPGGGYTLGRPPEEISVLQVLASVGEHVVTMSTNGSKTKTGVLIRSFFMKIDDQNLKKLDISLVELSNGNF